MNLMNFIFGGRRGNSGGKERRVSKKPSSHP
jgi:hypothetical protein